MGKAYLISKESLKWLHKNVILLDFTKHQKQELNGENISSTDDKELITSLWNVRNVIALPVKIIKAQTFQ